MSRARGLAGPGWQARVQAGAGDGPAEAFLALVRQQVLARAGSQSGGQGGGQTIETDCRPPVDGLVEAANRLAGTLRGLKRPMAELARRLLKRLDDEAAELDSAERARIESLSRSLRRRGELMAAGWVQMLARMVGEPDPMFVEWFAVEQAFGREGDIGLHSHWIDPTVPFAAAVLSQGDGLVITSATLKDRPPEAPEDWHNAEMRTGVVHLPYPVERVSYDSPFDYGANARVIVVTDVNRTLDGLTPAARSIIHTNNHHFAAIQERFRYLAGFQLSKLILKSFSAEIIIDRAARPDIAYGLHAFHEGSAQVRRIQGLRRHVFIVPARRIFAAGHREVHAVGDLRVQTSLDHQVLRRQRLEIADQPADVVLCVRTVGVARHLRLLPRGEL